MKDLDLTMVGMTNANSKQARKILNGRARQEALEDMNRTLSLIDNAKRETAFKNFCQNSIQNKNHSKRKQIHGKTYVGKKTFYVALAVAGTILASKGVQVASEISEYGRVLEQKVENELTDSEQALFEEEHTNGLLNIIDAYQNIQEGKESLDSEHYNFLGENIQNGSQEYLPSDEGFFNLSERQQDAIDVATDKVIEEYQGRGK